jgi:hypothetical protein
MEDEMAVKDPLNKKLRDHLIELLNGGSAHVTFDDAVKGMPEKLQGVTPKGLPHSAWMLLEHLRLTQWDILEFSRNEGAGCESQDRSIRTHSVGRWPDHPA